MAFVKVREIFDSRGNPTLEVDATLSDGSLARAAFPFPSGVSTGIYEALELRDGVSDYLGKGVLKDPTDQARLDHFIVQQLDGKQEHIANLAGNKNLVLPVSSFNIINVGSHDGNKLAMQEFMILPIGASSVKEIMKMGVEVYHHLKEFMILPIGASSFKKTMKMGVEVYHHFLLILSIFQRIERAINERTCNALHLKVNQTGSVTESIEAVKMSNRAGCGVMARHHSGENKDTSIADLSVELAMVIMWSEVSHPQQLSSYLVPDLGHLIEQAKGGGGSGSKGGGVGIGGKAGGGGSGIGGKAGGGGSGIGGSGRDRQQRGRGKGG